MIFTYQEFLTYGAVPLVVALVIGLGTYIIVRQVPSEAPIFRSISFVMLVVSGLKAAFMLLSPNQDWSRISAAGVFFGLVTSLSMYWVAGFAARSRKK